MFPSLFTMPRNFSFTKNKALPLGGMNFLRNTLVEGEWLVFSLHTPEKVDDRFVYEYTTA